MPLFAKKFCGMDGQLRPARAKPRLRSRLFDEITPYAIAQRAVDRFGRRKHHKEQQEIQSRLQSPEM